MIFKKLTHRHLSLLCAAGAVLLVIAIFAAVHYAMVAEERQTRAAAATNIANLALAFERQTASEVAAVEHLVLSLKDAAEQEDDGRMRSLLASVEQIHGKRVPGVAVMDANGDVVAASLPLKPTNLADRAYFQVFAKGETGNTYIGKPLLGRLSGRWTVQVAQRIQRKDGGFGGVVAASLDLAALSDFYRELKLGDSGFILLAGADGVVLARNARDGVRADYDLLAAWPDLWRALSHTQGDSVTVANTGGGNSIVSYRKVAGYSLIVVVGADENEVLREMANVHRTYLIGAGLLSLFALLLVGMLWWMVERIGRDNVARIDINARLRESELRYRDFAELSSDWWWEQDANLRYSQLPEFPGFAGVSTAQRLGRARWELGAVPLSTTWEAHKAQLQERLPFRNLVFRRDDHTGTYYLQVSGKPVFDADGEFRGYRGVTTDVTAQHQAAEEALRLSDHRYDSLFEASPLPMWVREVASRKFVAVNAKALEHYGYTREVFLALSPQEILVSGEWDRVRNEVATDDHAQVAIKRLRRHRTCDGREIDVEVTSRGIVFEGKPARLVIVQDMTERNRAEAELRISEGRLRALLDGIPDRAWLKDTQHRYIAINQSVVRDTGLPAAEILGHRLSDRKPGMAATRAEEDDARVMAEGVAVRLERQSTVDGTWREFVKVPVFGTDGTVIGTAGIARDISERRAMEEERRSRDVEQRRAFVREIHHRIKNHVQGVSGMLRGHVRTQPALGPFIEAAIGQLQSVAMVHGLLTASEFASLADIVKAISKSHRQSDMAAARQVSVNLNTAIAASLNEEDAIPVALIVNEMVLNAIKHASEAGIVVGLNAVDDGVCISVSNAGQLSRKQPQAPNGSGLRIVRSLLPPCGASFDLGDDKDGVSALLMLRPPVVLMQPSHVGIAKD